MQRLGLDWSQRRLLVALGLVVLVGGGWWYLNRQASTPLPDDGFGVEELIDPTPLATPTILPIAVDVIGAVVQPGVYFLAPPARVQDAVLAAGGLAPDADREAINMAAHVTDAQQIRVPRASDDPPALTSRAPASDSAASSNLINLNTADGATLATLPEVGPAMAQRIIDYRTENGPFQSIDELQNVKGIGTNTYDQLKDLITVGQN